MNHKQFKNLERVIQEKGVNFDIPIMSALDQDIQEHINNSKSDINQQVETKDNKTGQGSNESLADKFRAKRKI